MKVPEKYRVKSGPLSTTVEDGNKPGFSFCGSEEKVPQ